MRKVSVFLGLIFILSSCQVTERFYLHDDGSVTEEKKIDFSAVMAMKGDESLLDVAAIDTIVEMDADFSQILPKNENSEEETSKYDELKEEMDKTKAHILQNDDELIVTLITEAESIEELNQYNERLNRRKMEIDEQDANPKPNEVDMLNFATYSYDGSSFERHILGDSFLRNEQEAEEGQPDMDPTEMFLFGFEYHFPKTIKNVSLENAEIGEDGKTVRFGQKLSDILDDEEGYRNIKVVFE